MALSRQVPKKSYRFNNRVSGFPQGKKKAGITRGQGIHCLRHSFATHLLSHGTDIYTIKRLLGHSAIQTTIIYLHLVEQRITRLKSPLDYLFEEKGGNDEKQ